MIAISRDLARRFRALARKCPSGRPRGPAPPVVVQVRSGRLILWARTANAGLRYEAPTDGKDETLVMPMEVLAAVETASPDPVELAVGPRLDGTATWSNRGLPQTYPFVALLPGKQHEVPALPEKGHPVPESFLSALHECGRTADQESLTRFALDHVQVRGQTGQVIGTDSRQALLWGGFRLPFTDDLLVPAIPVFGTKGLLGREKVQVARTSEHLVVTVGPWSVFLTLKEGGRYPDVASVVPRSYSASVAGIDERDAEALAEALAKWPASAEDDDGRPVTLDLNGGVRVRSRGPAADTVFEISLERSTTSGPAVQVALPRAALARALALGCFTARVVGASKPVVFENEDRLFVVMSLDPSCVVATGQPVEVPFPVALPEPVSHPPDPLPERSRPVKADDSNGRPPNGRADPPPPDGFDPLVEAEALRAALAEAAARAARLVAALRYTRKQKKQLESVMAGLRSLHLRP